MTNNYSESPLPPEWGKLKRGTEQDEVYQEQVVKDEACQEKIVESDLIEEDYTETIEQSEEKDKLNETPQLNNKKKHVHKNNTGEDVTGRKFAAESKPLDGLLDKNSILKGIVLAEILGPPRSRKKNLFHGIYCK